MGVSLMWLPAGILWGALYLGARRARNGTPKITRSTWELVRDDFAIEPRSLVEVKGKGKVETWHLVGPKGAEFEVVESAS